MSDNKTRFNPFYYTTQSCISCQEAMYVGMPADGTDAQRGSHCQLECQWICWPFCISFDIISCPFRGAYYCQQKYCKCSKSNPDSKFGDKPTVETQPN